MVRILGGCSTYLPHPVLLGRMSTINRPNLRLLYQVVRAALMEMITVMLAAGVS